MSDTDHPPPNSANNHIYGHLPGCLFDPDGKPGERWGCVPGCRHLMPVWKAMCRASPRLELMTEAEIESSVKKAKEGKGPFISHDEMLAQIADRAAEDWIARKLRRVVPVAFAEELRAAYAAGWLDRSKL